MPASAAMVYSPCDTLLSPTPPPATSAFPEAKVARPGGQNPASAGSTGWTQPPKKNSWPVQGNSPGNATFLWWPGATEVFPTSSTRSTQRRGPSPLFPSGSGNAMGHALHLRGSIAEVAMRIKEGRIHEFDLIQCDERRLAYMASIGLEGAVIQRSNEYKAQGASGFKAYLMAVLAAYFKDFKGVKASIAINGQLLRNNFLAQHHDHEAALLRLRTEGDARSLL